MVTVTGSFRLAAYVRSLRSRSFDAEFKHGYGNDQKVAYRRGLTRATCLEPHVVNRLRAMRGPGESYSDVIITISLSRFVG
jgi:hypothetical protein